MAPPQNKFGLSIDCSPKMVHKKYLGEPDDPHYIPPSPLIIRQSITPQQEGELKRICALVLANVPHSDDMPQDPFKPIPTQIESRTVVPPLKAPISVPAPKLGSAFGGPLTRQIPIDTATPSQSSQQDSPYKTDYSTPRTSAGITPGETGKRFSDAAKKPASARTSNNLKKQASIKSKNKSASNAGTPASHNSKTSRAQDATKPSADSHTAEVSKYTVKLVYDPEAPSEVDSQRLSEMDLNKALPPPPGGGDSGVEELKKQPITRLIKSIRKKKNPLTERELPTLVPPPASLPISSVPSRPHTAPAPQRQEAPLPKSLLQQHSLPPLEPKRRFRLRFFGRRARTVDALVA